MKRKLRVSHAATVDLLEIWRYIAKDSIQAADKHEARIIAHLNLLLDAPWIGKMEPGLPHGMRLTRKGNYWIIYRPEDEEIFVLRVVHTRRDIAGIRIEN